MNSPVYFVPPRLRANNAMAKVAEVAKLSENDEIYNLTTQNVRHGPFNVYSAQRLDLFARCVRLSRLLVGCRTHFKSLHFHSFIHSFIKRLIKNTQTTVLYNCHVTCAFKQTEQCAAFHAHFPQHSG